MHENFLKLSANTFVDRPQIKVSIITSATSKVVWQLLVFSVYWQVVAININYLVEKHTAELGTTPNFNIRVHTLYSYLAELHVVSSLFVQCRYTSQSACPFS